MLRTAFGSPRGPVPRASPPSKWPRHFCLARSFCIETSWLMAPTCHTALWSTEMPIRNEHDVIVLWLDKRLAG